MHGATGAETLLTTDALAVKSHLSHVFAKLGVSTRSELEANWPRRSA